MSEIKRQFLSIVGVNPTVAHDSSSRVQMLSSHLGQSLVLIEGTERYHQTGVETNLAGTTFSVSSPEDCTVIGVHNRYKRAIGVNSFKYNPQTIVTYKENDTGVIGCINIEKYCANHQHFGFSYKPTASAAKLFPGANLSKDEILFDSPAVTENGGYKFGRELNVAFMTLPSVTEDGILISRQALDKLKFEIFETRVVEFGSNKFPLNIYGDDQEYKIFPEIGDYIREDGLLMAFREHDKLLSVVEQTSEALRVVDHQFDDLIYGGPGPGGQIIDIRVTHDPNQGTNLPNGMEEQALKYNQARLEFYREILTEYEKQKRSLGYDPVITKEYEQLIVDALAALDNKERVQKLYRAKPLDDFRIEFVIKYTIVPTLAFKMTCLHGGI